MVSILIISEFKLFNSLNFCSFRNHSSLDINNCVSSSKLDHFAIYRNCLYSCFQFLQYHSAIFEGIEITDLFICETIQNNSSLEIVPNMSLSGLTR